MEEGQRGRSTESIISIYSRGSSSGSTYMPRRVESLVALDDAINYYDQQTRQRPAGGAHFERGRSFPPPSLQTFTRRRPHCTRRHSADSVHSSGSVSSVSLHFSVPLRPQAAHTTSVTVEPALVQGALTSLPPGPPRLKIPAAAHTTHSTVASSPLARKSFTRLATDDTTTDSASQLSRRHSLAEVERRGRRSASVDQHERSRLSKRRATNEGR
jgi:hypothetical protein